MDRDILITGYPSVDFILTHIFSIILFSRNGITPKDKTSNLVALYPKGLPVQRPDCSWKKYRTSQNPCLITTAYSIQLLAKTANFIIKSPKIFKNSSLASTIGTKFANLSALQLDYCLENLENSYPSIELYTSLLEGCLIVSDLKDDRYLSYDNAIEILYNKLTLDLDVDSLSTLELSRLINALQQILYRTPSHPAREVIATTTLELIHRRNSLGLFQRDRVRHMTAPLSWQFYCIASLLSSYSVYPIDKVLEETFSIFNHLYNLSWNSSLGFFTFSRSPYIRYTSFEIAAIIKAICLISTWVSEDEKNQLDQILSDSYFPILFEEFFTNYNQSIHLLYHHFMNQIQLSDNNLPGNNLKIRGYSLESRKAPVFPSAIQIEYSSPYTSGVLLKQKNPQINWIDRSPLQLNHSLELCIYLIDYLVLHNQKQEKTEEEDLSSSLLDILFSIIPQHD